MIKKTFNRMYDTDIGYSFFNSKIAIISSTVFFIIFLCSFFAGLVAPYNPFDPASVSLMDAFTPPIWSEGGSSSFFLGTDQQGRDMFSTMIYGSRISLIVGFASIIHPHHCFTIDNASCRSLDPLISRSGDVLLYCSFSTSRSSTGSSLYRYLGDCQRADFNFASIRTVHEAEACGRRVRTRHSSVAPIPPRCVADACPN